MGLGYAKENGFLDQITSHFTIKPETIDNKQIKWKKSVCLELSKNNTKHEILINYKMSIKLAGCCIILLFLTV